MSEIAEEWELEEAQRRVDRVLDYRIKSALSPHWGKPVRSDEPATKNIRIRGLFDSVNTRCA